MRILIVGLPKSGTTILTYRIAGALDGVTVEFEPPGGPDPALADVSEHLVTKKLLGHQTATLREFARYDRRVWICRDPRDFMVSQALYRWHREAPPTPDDQARFDRLLARLEAKEASPHSVPFLALEPDDYRTTFDHVAELWRQESDPSWLLYRYEDMVDGRYDALNRYLGFDVDDQATVAPGLERVVRRKASGDWRRWFTEVDVARYADGGLQHYMETFGYDPGDWALDPEPELEPAHGSRYARNLFTDHRTRADETTADAPPAVEHRTLEPVTARGGAAGRPRRALARLLGRFDRSTA